MIQKLDSNIRYVFNTIFLPEMLWCLIFCTVHTKAFSFSFNWWQFFKCFWKNECVRQKVMIVQSNIVMFSHDLNLLFAYQINKYVTLFLNIFKYHRLTVLNMRHMSFCLNKCQILISNSWSLWKELYVCNQNIIWSKG